MFEDDLYFGEEDACPHCGGPLQYIGTLGRRVHFKCRDCGAPRSSTDCVKRIETPEHEPVE